MNLCTCPQWAHIGESVDEDPAFHVHHFVAPMPDTVPQAFKELALYNSTTCHRTANAPSGRHKNMGQSVGCTATLRFYPHRRHEGLGWDRKLKPLHLCTDTVIWKNGILGRFSSLTTPCLWNDPLQPSEGTSQSNRMCAVSHQQAPKNPAISPPPFTLYLLSARNALNAIYCLLVEHLFCKKKSKDLYTLLSHLF